MIVEKEWLDPDLMQKIALENNLSETAFVKIIDAENYEIRWFTPTVEADFCGHATLASAFVIFKDFTGKKAINFHVRNLGLFIVHQDDDGKIRMNFPIRKAHQVEDYPAVLREALTKPFKAVYQNDYAYIVEYESVQDVLDEQPDMSLLKTLGKLRTAITAKDMDIAITSKPDQQYDCVSRYFAPVAGINEDPVTGSVHTAIAPLWAEKLGKNNILAYQASSRGGVLYCNILSEERIEISGYGKLYMQAEIFL